MRVMHIVDSMGHGGAEWLIVEHVRHAGAGVESLVCAVNRGGAALEAAAALGARTFVLGKGTRRLEGALRLARLAREHQVDVLHGHNPVGGLYAALAALRAPGSIVFRTEHSVHYRGRHSVVYPFLELGVTALTRRVVCVCQAVLESHVRRMPWAARRFVTVANGISPAPHTRPREAVRRELGLADDDRVVLTVGSLTPAKAQHVLLAAFARAAERAPAARLLIAGEGPLREALESRARPLADRVRFLGARTDVADLLGAADVFALSSNREGLPVTVLEAMRGGRPVVAPDVGGVAEAVRDGVTGRIVGAGQDLTQGLGQALAELLLDPRRAAEMGARARERWASEFTAERMVGETEALYREALARRGRAPAPALEEGRHATPGA